VKPFPIPKSKLNVPDDEEEDKMEDENPAWWWRWISGWNWIGAAGSVFWARGFYEDDEEPEDDNEDILPNEDDEDVSCKVDAFGTGLDKHKECKTCPIWDECSDESERLEKEKKATKKTTGKRKK